MTGRDSQEIGRVEIGLGSEVTTSTVRAAQRCTLTSVLYFRVHVAARTAESGVPGTPGFGTPLSLIIDWK